MAACKMPGVIASAILVVFATCLLRSDDEITNANSPVSATEVPIRQALPARSNRPFHVDVPLVLVNVSAVDSKGRIVTGLRKDDFAIYEDGQPQRVSQFSMEDVPISVGIVFDASGSMANKIDSARMVALEFVRTANPADEFCLIAFSERPSKVGECTLNTSAVITELNSLRAGGRTSLLDAIYLGMDEMRRAKHSRQVLLIFSDGGDNHSRYTEADLKRVVQETDTQVYAVDIHGPILRNFANSRPLVPTREERLVLVEKLAFLKVSHSESCAWETKR